MRHGLDLMLPWLALAAVLLLVNLVGYTSYCRVSPTGKRRGKHGVKR